MRDTDIQRQRDQGRYMTQRGGESGDWRGFVQPYEYYGPGYRGVGYYAVYYQGSPETRGTEQGDMDEPQTQFDQRNVQYGQGQGAGAGWNDRRRGSWGRDWGRDEPGAWRDRARQFGQFAGRGPKGYQRSDERIREDVSDRLMEHPDIDASDIEVKVKGGVVTLTGTVDDRWAKRFAEDTAETVMGVTDVMNQLAVQSRFDESDRMAGGRGSGRTRTETAAVGTGTRGTTEATPSGGQPRNGRRTMTADR